MHARDNDIVKYTTKSSGRGRGPWVRTEVRLELVRSASRSQCQKLAACFIGLTAKGQTCVLGAAHEGGLSPERPPLHRVQRGGAVISGDHTPV